MTGQCNSCKYYKMSTWYMNTVESLNSVHHEMFVNYNSSCWRSINYVRFSIFTSLLMFFLSASIRHLFPSLGLRGFFPLGPMMFKFIWGTSGEISTFLFFQLV